MKKILIFCTIACTALLILTGYGSTRGGGVAQSPSTSAKHSGKKAPAVKETHSAAKSSADETEGLEIKRQQLIEKEAALKAKEQELNSLAARLEARINELNAAQKAMEASRAVRKKESDERYRRILKIYKALRPAEAGKLLNNLDDDMVIEMLNQMDQKTAVKLIPHLKQPNVLRWTRENLKGK